MKSSPSDSEMKHASEWLHAHKHEYEYEYFDDLAKACAENLGFWEDDFQIF